MIDVIRRRHRMARFEPFRNAPICGAALIAVLGILVFGLTGCSPKCFRADTNHPCPVIPFELAAR